ncbi:MAG: hypothetical protein F6J86_05410 [Symploca sp. SIO1B1]|nr:hypothetical protein [Symploca sp. SIO1B1]
MCKFKEVMREEFRERGLNETDASSAANGLWKLKDKQEPTAEEIRALGKTIPTHEQSVAIIEKAKQFAQSQSTRTEVSFRRKKVA